MFFKKVNKIEKEKKKHTMIAKILVVKLQLSTDHLNLSYQVAFGDNEKNIQVNFENKNKNNQIIFTYN